jgi:hypothetical protein
MSRRAIVAVLAVYVVVALGFGCALEWAKPLPLDDTTTGFAGNALAIAAKAFLISGALPLLVWAWRRFGAEQAAGPLFVWGALGIVCMVLLGLGTFWNQKIAMGRAEANITSLSGSVHDTFVRSLNQGCVENQRRRQSQGQGQDQDNVTIGQIKTYCHCFADAIAGQVTAEEIMELTRDGKPPASFDAKAEKIAPACSRLALGH